MTDNEKRICKALMDNMGEEELVKLVTLLAYTGCNDIVGFHVWKTLKTHIEELGYNDTHILVNAGVEVEQLEIVDPEEVE